MRRLLPFIICLIIACTAWLTALAQSSGRGLVYERINPQTGRSYIGRTTEGRFARRQAEHRRANGGVEFRYEVLARPKRHDAAIVEQGLIRKYQDRGYDLENKRQEMTQERFMREVERRLELERKRGEESGRRLRTERQLQERVESIRRRTQRDRREREMFRG